MFLVELYSFNQVGAVLSEQQLLFCITCIFDNTPLPVNADPPQLQEPDACELFLDNNAVGSLVSDHLVNNAFN